VSSPALRKSFGRKHQVNVFVAVVIFAGEGDHRSFGRKARIDLDTDIVRQPFRVAAVSRLFTKRLAAVVTKALDAFGLEGRGHRTGGWI
jgi:hypothetical protein